MADARPGDRARHRREGHGEPRWHKQPWAAGDTFTLADCAAAPALFYADMVAPFAGTYPNLVAYLERLKQRPSYARTLQEAEPCFKFFPKEEAA